jgi:hypothetical protein
MKNIDVVILTERRYCDTVRIGNSNTNVFLEDDLIRKELENEGLTTIRLPWDDSNFDWSSTKFVLFRSTWDYFNRFEEFSSWLNTISKQTQLINPEQTIRWNIDKHYLLDLEQKGVHCVPTVFLEKGTTTTLKEVYKQHNFNETVLKPAVSGTARHTYRLNSDTISNHETILKELTTNEAMLLQPFQYDIVEKGEVSLVIINGKFTHAVLKVAKTGDFRVQDEFGGSVHDYIPTHKEIAFAENSIKVCNPMPLYARVDILTDNNGNLALVELELVEPELWFRKNTKAAKALASAIKKLF